MILLFLKTNVNVTQLIEYDLYHTATHNLHEIIINVNFCLTFLIFV